MANIVTTMANRQRTQRRPDHTFLLKAQAFVIQPFCLAPVLPGETLVNLLLQARVVTDPIKNPLTGWWLEYHFFYVKHRDLVGTHTTAANFSTVLQNMMLNPNEDVSAWRNTGNDPQTYQADGSLAFTQHILRRVVDTYFRAGDESWATAAGILGGTGLDYLARADMPGWMESLAPGALATPTDDIEIADISAQTTFQGGDDKITVSEINEAQQRWALLRMQNLTTQTYDEFLATYGIRMPDTQQHMPELIRSVRAWQYPTNTIDPTNGTPRSAVSWSIAERADKPRFFSEPGWIFGVTVCRPKVYSSVQIGSLGGFMDDAYAWMPAILMDDAEVGLKEYSTTADAPLNPATTTAVHTADFRDLFHGGDQFINFDPTTAGWNTIALPSADLTNKRYPSSTDLDGLFVTADTAEFIKHDGIVRLSIESYLRAGPSLEGTGAPSTTVPV